MYDLKTNWTIFDALGVASGRLQRVDRGTVIQLPVQRQGRRVNPASIKDRTMIESAARRRDVNPDVAALGALIGDPARCAMLFALLDGGELNASELARRATASPQATSAHLGKLVAGGLVVARQAGRNRLFRLASADAARAIEALAVIAPSRPIVALEQNTLLQRMCHARSCYDHLAGALGVGVTDHLVRIDALRPSSAGFDVTTSGTHFLLDLGLDLDRARAARRAFARACIDWTERRPHLAGSLGAALLDMFLQRGWLARNSADRALKISAAGSAAFERWFDVRR